MKLISNLIHQHRKKAALTQAQLATLAGVGKTAVWDLEHGKESVQWDTLNKILRVLTITIEFRSPLLQRLEAAAAGPAAPTPSPSLSSASLSSGSSPPRRAQHPPSS